jgi:hypothetical protein
MRYSKYLTIPLCSFVLMSAPAFAQQSARPHVVLKPLKERYQRGSNPRGDPTMALTPGPGNDNTDFSRCMSDWDAASHMTKQEWRAACRRALSDYPGAFRY